MRTPGPHRFFVCTLALVILGLSAWLGSGRTTQAQQPPQSPEGTATDTRPNLPSGAGSEADQAGVVAGADHAALSEWAGQEALARAREELATLELRLSAKKALLREAGTALNIEKSLQADYERLGKKGLTSAIGRKRTDQDVLRAEANRAVLQADVAETEAQFQQARRRLGILQKYGAAALPLIESPGDQPADLERRVKILEQKVRLLQNGLQRSQGQVDFLLFKQRQRTQAPPGADPK